MIQARYRYDYPGEFVITKTTWANGQKTQEREWVPNPINNQHLSHRAACIGSDLDLWQFDHTVLQRHRGGLLGTKKLQTYGVGDISRNMRLDFCVETNSEKLEEISKTKYQENNIVYTTGKLCLQYPGEFYLIPYNPAITLYALPIYLAAFDGHEEIFMLGYNKDLQYGTTSAVEQIKQLILAYAGTKFWTIGVESNIPTMWFECPNVDHMTYNQWRSYCDV